MKLYQFQGSNCYYAVAESVIEAREKIKDDIGYISYGWTVNKTDLPSYGESE